MNIPPTDTCEMSKDWLATKTSSPSGHRCFKTRMCSFFLDGKCSRGIKCSFAHAWDEVRQAPDLSKTKICILWKKGMCHDINCSYAHGADQLRRTECENIIARKCHPLPYRALHEFESRSVSISVSGSEVSVSDGGDTTEAISTQSHSWSSTPVLSCESIPSNTMKEEGMYLNSPLKDSVASLSITPVSPPEFCNSAKFLVLIEAYRAFVSPGDLQRAALTLYED